VCANGYGRRTALTCAKCMSKGARGVLFAIGCLTLVALVAWTAHSAWTTNNKSAAAAAAASMPGADADGGTGAPKEQQIPTESIPGAPQPDDIGVQGSQDQQLGAAGSLPITDGGDAPEPPGGKGVHLWRRRSSKIITSFKGLVNDPDDSPEAAASCPFELLKILVRFLQYLLIIFTAQAPWPSSWRVTASALSVMFSTYTSALGLDCMLPSPALDKQLPIAARAAIAQELLPFAVFAAMTLAILLNYYIRGRCSGRRARRAGQRKLQQQPLDTFLKARLPTLALVRFWGWVCLGGGRGSFCCAKYQLLLGAGSRSTFASHSQLTLNPQSSTPYPSPIQTTLFVMYPNMTRVALSSFACFPVDTNEPNAPYAAATAAAGATGSFWVPDMQQKCWQGWHLRWSMAFGIPLTLLLVVGVPVALALTLHFYRKKLDTPSAHRYLGFVYLPYRRACSNWEAVQTVQTAALVAVAVFSVRIGPYFTLLLLTSMFVFLLALQLTARPHTARAAHLAQVAALCVLATVTFIALSFFPMVEFEARPSDLYREFMGAVLLIAVLAYFCAVLLAVGLGLAERVQQGLQLAKRLTAATVVWAERKWVRVKACGGGVEGAA